MTECTDWAKYFIALLFQYFVFMKWEQSVSQSVRQWGGKEEWSSNNGLMMIRAGVVRVLLLLKLRCEKEIFE